MKFEDKVAIITGASRGIGKALAVGLAREGCHIVAAAKSVTEDPRIPGTIHDTAREVEALGRRALPYQVDLRDALCIEEMVLATVGEFGRVDFLINNAGAIFLHDVEHTPTKRYDLVNALNSRAPFVAARECIPHMKAQGFGHIINMSPPLEPSMAPGKVAYTISKLGMTLLTLGLAEELRGASVAVNSLWPETMVESAATINWKMGNKQTWRTPQVMVDAVVGIFSQDPNEFTGNTVLDETFLRQRCGVEDFSGYRCDPEHEPPKVGLNWKLQLR